MGFFSGLLGGVKDVLSGGIGDLIGVGASFLGGERTNSANAEQAELNRQFQANQTGTAYQRAVEDLKAAGLNPMLAYPNGGAASAAGAMAQMGNSLGQAVSTSLQSRELSSKVKQMDIQNENIAADTDKKVAEKVNTNIQSQLAMENIGVAKMNQALLANSAAKVAQDTYMDSLSIPAMLNAMGVEQSSAGGVAAWLDRFSKSVGNLRGAVGRDNPRFTPLGSHGAFNPKTGEIIGGR